MYYSGGSSEYSWSQIGQQLATGTINATLPYRVVSIKKKIRPFYRLKIYVNDLNGGTDSDHLDAKLKLEEQEQYNQLILSDIVDEQKKSLLFTKELWKKERLKQLYNNAIRSNNTIIDKYKNGEKVFFDAGFDLFTPSYYVFDDLDNTTHKIDHCINCSMERVDTDENGIESTNPVGYYLYPRSSTGTKTPLSLANSTGIIDSGYRGNIISAFYKSRSHDTFVVSLFQRLVQICPPDLTYPMEVVLVSSEDELGNGGARGQGGFGSTGS